MKLFKTIMVFAVAFLFAWILIFTFIQEPFRQLASARVLKWWTPAFPIYLYVAGAFAIGFGFGLAVALYNYFTLQSKLHHKEKECRKLETEVTDAEDRIKRLELVAAEQNGYQPQTVAVVEADDKSADFEDEDVDK